MRTIALVKRLLHTKTGRYAVASLAGIAATASALWISLVLTSPEYFESHRARNEPVWLSNLYLSARQTLGEYREPPSDEEMIRYFNAHESEFEQLVDTYYALIAKRYEIKRPLDITELMKFPLAELGLARVSIAGPGLITSVHGKEPFQTLGMQLVLFDRGGSFRLYKNAGKAYVYQPRLTDQRSLVSSQVGQKKTPISHLLNTGAYNAKGGMAELDKKNKDHIAQDCGMQVINDNWAVVHCVNISN